MQNSQIFNNTGSHDDWNKNLPLIALIFGSPCRHIYCIEYLPFGYTSINPLTLVEIFFRIIKNIFRFLRPPAGTPLQPKRRKVRIKIGYKGCVDLISEGIFRKYSKMKIWV